ncbi:hypothetical protein AgCh_002946 [Apium graveolens]
MILNKNSRLFNPKENMQAKTVLGLKITKTIKPQASRLQRLSNPKQLKLNKQGRFGSGLSQEFADGDESRGTETQGCSPLLLAPNDNSGERAAPSDGVPGPSAQGHHDAANKHHDAVPRTSVPRTTSKLTDLPELSDVHRDMCEDPSSSGSFEYMMKTTETKDQGNGSIGLEIVRLDLPDSFCEVILSRVLVLQGEWLLALVSHSMQARAHKGRSY